MPAKKYTVFHNSCPDSKEIKQIWMHGPIFNINRANQIKGVAIT